MISSDDVDRPVSETSGLAARGVNLKAAGLGVAAVAAAVAVPFAENEAERLANEVRREWNGIETAKETIERAAEPLAAVEAAIDTVSGAVQDTVGRVGSDFSKISDAVRGFYPNLDYPDPIDTLPSSPPCVVAESQAASGGSPSVIGDAVEHLHSGMTSAESAEHAVDGMLAAFGTFVAGVFRHHSDAAEGNHEEADSKYRDPPYELNNDATSEQQWAHEDQVSQGVPDKANADDRTGNDAIDGSDQYGLFSPAVASCLFPDSSREHVESYLPLIKASLRERGIDDPAMTLYALSTIRAETEGFLPRDEKECLANSRDAPFDRYEHRSILGNVQDGDGERFRGRGFIQLTGRSNYKLIGDQIGVDLVDTPELANRPDIAATVFSQFLKNHESAIRDAMAAGDLAAARKVVAGSTAGLDRFQDAFEKGRAELGRGQSWEIA